MSTITKGDDARQLAKQLLDTYFKTADYPFTRHHIDSYDQFLSEGIPSIIRARNPILILKDYIESKKDYKYRVEIYVGGEDGKGIYIGTPTVNLQDSEEVRVLFPNEARLRNLSYSSTILVDVFIRISILLPNAEGVLQPNNIDINLRKTDNID